MKARPKPDHTAKKKSGGPSIDTVIIIIQHRAKPGNLFAWNRSPDSDNKLETDIRLTGHDFGAGAELRLF